MLRAMRYVNAMVAVRHCRRWRGAWAALALLVGVGCQPQQSDPIRPETITLLIWEKDRIVLPIATRLQAFNRRSNIRVNIKTVKQLGEVFNASQSPNNDVDVVVGLNVWVGDFVNNGFIDPLDKYMVRDADDPELSLATIPQGINEKNKWGGRTYSMICDNDNMFLIYRKDVLSDPMWQAAFAAELKHPLPNPPTTIDELVEVATFFNNKDWDNDGAKEHGFAISTESPDELMYFYALGFTTPYTVMPTQVARNAGEPQGLFLFKRDMTPLVNTTGFKTGISRWYQLAKLAAPNTTRQGVIDQMVNGEALMAIDWGDTGPASVNGMLPARGRLGFALSPGTHAYYNWLLNQMTEVPNGVHYAPLNQANGFAFYMTSTSEHKEAVWKFIKYMNSPEVSMGIVTDIRGGYQPWRTTHNDVTKWMEAGWNQEDAANYVDTILKTTNHENRSLDLRIPGIAAYGAVLEKHLVNILASPTGTPDIDGEMKACADDMDQVTKDNLIEAQRAALRAHLGLLDQ
jgi:multiple sugar transport system substrate-binding protein